MNVIIADSGSTKTEWILIDSSGNRSLFKTSGLNPYFLSESEITERITDQLKQQIIDIEVDEVHFYGAGCGSEVNKKVVANAISACFQKAAVFVESDLLGAARACFGNTEGVVCILGTGSNSCLYDGHKITKSIPSLGFIMGDEGSGGYFGKKILNSYFYRTMPEELRQALEKSHDMNLENVLNHVYKQPQANRYVASFTKLLFDFKDHPYCRTMLREGFEDFVSNQLNYFGDLSGKKISFVGSIATHREILEEVLNEHSLLLDTVIQKPINNLVEYHLG